MRMVEVIAWFMKRKELILINTTNFPNPMVFKQDSFSDLRGVMAKIAPVPSLNLRFDQISITSNSAKGVFRGFHATKACDEHKIITCLKGEIADYCLDLRLGSPTFLHCVRFQLTAGDGQTVLVPPGYGHGVESLSDNSEFIYCSDKPYRPLDEFVVNANDHLIKWCGLKPNEITRSEKDTNASFLNDKFMGLKCL